MKKIVLTTFLSIFCFALYAQPTLNASTNNPVAGEIYYGHYLDTAGVNKGAAGASVTWNFSAATQIDLDTTYYLSCASTPYCDSFPGSNIVFLTDSDYYYGVSGTTGMVFTGVKTDTLFEHFTNPKDLISYPLTYNTVHLDTSAVVVPYSMINIYVTTYDSFMCDAYGTLILPSGTYSNALRVHTVEIFKDSVNFLGIPEVNLSRTDMYTWYVAGFNSPLMSITYDTAGSTAPYKSEAKYYTHITPPATGIDNISDKTDLTLYPNPAGSVINARFDLADNKSAEMTITDMMGRTVKIINSNEFAAGRNNLSIPVTDLADGMYVVRLRTAAGVVSNKITIQK